MMFGPIPTQPGSAQASNSMRNNPATEKDRLESPTILIANPETDSATPKVLLSPTDLAGETAGILPDETCAGSADCR